MPKKRPNILLLMTDEQRFDQLGCVNRSVITPHLDALARDGVLFKHGYTPSPSCVPARAALMTGMYPSQNGAPTFVTYLPDDAQTFMAMLRDSGYFTAVVGKQHFGKTNFDRGYLYEEIIDAHYAADDVQASRAKNSYFAWLADQGVRGLCDLADPLFPMVQRWKAEPHLHIDAFVGERSLRWLKEDRPADRPWFLFASFPGPHMPIDGLGLPHERWYDGRDIDMPQTCAADLDSKPPHLKIAHGTTEPGEISREQIRLARLSSHANTSLIDEHIGRIIAYLKEVGEYDNTLILFVSDHGDFLGDFGWLGKSQCVAEVLMRIPFIVKPHRTGGASGMVTRQRIESSMVNLVDIAPTCLAAAGITQPMHMPGTDLSRYWESDRDLSDRNRIYMEAGGIRALRDGEWKICHYFERPYGELYNLQDDPWERRNLWDDPTCRDKRESMRVALLEELIRLSPRHQAPWNDTSSPPSPDI